MQPKPWQIWMYKYNPKIRIKLTKNRIDSINKEKRWYAWVYVKTPILYRIYNFFIKW